MKSFLKIIFILIFLSAPFLAGAAGLVPCGDGRDVAQACTLCHFIVGIQRLVQYGQGILISVAAVAIFIAGIMYVISSGNEGMMTQAKGFLKTSLMGFSIVLCSWLIVNVVMWILSVNMTTIGKVNWYTFSCVTQSSATGTTPPTTAPPTYPEDTQATNSGYTYDPGIQSQTADASASLNSMLNCMRTKLPDGAKRLSSISDSAGMANCVNNYNSSTCAHTQYSCHYGGRNCRGELKSYAADFGNESFSSQIQSAASQCGGTSINEGNHIHVSTGNCGCDGH